MDLWAKEQILSHRDQPQAELSGLTLSRYIEAAPVLNICTPANHRSSIFTVCAAHSPDRGSHFSP